MSVCVSGAQLDGWPPVMFVLSTFELFYHIDLVASSIAARVSQIVQVSKKHICIRENTIWLEASYISNRGSNMPVS